MQQPIDEEGRVGELKLGRIPIGACAQKEADALEDAADGSWRLLIAA